MKNKIINGTVLKVTETEIVLLTNDGTFKNIPKTSTEVPLIGQAYSYKESKRKYKQWGPYSAMAVALLLLIFTSFALPFGGSAEEAFIITVDINPSIEVATDDQHRVIRAEGLNEDGQNILDELELETNLYDVMQQIMDETIKSGFVQVEEPLIATSVVPLERDSKEIISLIEKSISNSLQEHQVVSEVIISNEEMEMYKEAKEHNLSMNYYKEYKILEARGIVKDEVEIKGKTLAELKRMENKERKEEKQKSGTAQPPNKELKPVEVPVKSKQEGKNKETKSATEKQGNQLGNQEKKKEKMMEKNSKKISDKPEKEQAINKKQQTDKEKGSEKKEKPNPKNPQSAERNARN